MSFIILTIKLVLWLFNHMGQSTEQVVCEKVRRLLQGDYNILLFIIRGKGFEYTCSNYTYLCNYIHVCISGPEIMF